MISDEITLSIGKLTISYSELEIWFSMLFNDIKVSTKGGLEFLKDKGIQKMLHQIGEQSKIKIKNF